MIVMVEVGLPEGGTAFTPCPVHHGGVEGGHPGLSSSQLNMYAQTEAISKNFPPKTHMITCANLH